MISRALNAQHAYDAECVCCVSCQTVHDSANAVHGLRKKMRSHPIRVYAYLKSADLHLFFA